MNSEPLSDWREARILNHGIISQRRNSENGRALLLVLENASAPPENMSTKNRSFTGPTVTRDGLLLVLL